MSLYKEYRPQHLDDVKGNTAVVQGLREHFSQEARRVSHVHLFSGPSGCGKTTLARIVATDILGADELSIHEINFAEMRGIDTAREVIERMKGLPLSGNATVFILDEAHGMTADATRGANMNALGRRCASTVFIMIVSGLILYLVYGVGARDLGERLERREKRRRFWRKITGRAEKEAKA